MPDIDLQAEQERMQNAAWVRVVAEMQWRRTVTPIVNGLGSRSSLEGPGGRLLREAIESKFSPGPNTISILKDGEQSNAGIYPARWAAIGAHVEPHANPLQQQARERALLYRGGLQISGEISSPAWDWLYPRAKIDRVMAHKQDAMLLLGSCVVRPTLRPCGGGKYYPAGLTVVTPDRCIAIENPGAPGTIAIYLEQVNKNTVLVIDTSDINNPVFGAWTSFQAYTRRSAPIWSLSGDAFPWRWQGEVFNPATPVQDKPNFNTLLPDTRSDAQSAVDLILGRAWINYCRHMTSFSKPFIMSQMELSGLESTFLDPSVVTALHGGGQKSLDVIPDGLDAATKAMEIHRASLQEFSQRYDTGFSLVESSASGKAMLIKLSGKEGVRNQMLQAAIPVDKSAIRALIATHNYLVRSGQIDLTVSEDGTVRWLPGRGGAFSPELLIPEGEIDLEYPHVWYQAEKVEIRKEMAAAADAGYRDVREIWLFDRDLTNDGPDGPNWQRATDAITQNLDFAMSLAAQGFGLDWKTRAVIASQTPEDEADLHIPPADVATTAAKGLALRDEFRGRALVGLQARTLLSRARMLSNQTPLTTGAVRELQQWLETHKDDASKLNVSPEGLPMPGEWGNDANPSGAYITWLSQGGDAAISWCILTLAPTDGTQIDSQDATTVEVSNVT